MKSRFLATLAAISLALPAWAEPANDLLAGDPVTAETLILHAELIRIADALDGAVDAKDWTLARSFFADEITVDFTSLSGGDPAKIPADALIAAWSGNLTAEKTSFHLRGNHRITFDASNTATMVSHGYAWNRMERGGLPENGGDPMWEVWGAYEHVFEETEQGWLLIGMSFFATAERGSDFVRNTPGN